MKFNNNGDCDSFSNDYEKFQFNFFFLFPEKYTVVFLFLFLNSTI